MGRVSFLNRILVQLGITVCILFSKALAQTSDFTAINKQFDNYRKQVLQEKIYVHTDKDFYLAGELMWFKLYNLDASLHHTIDISKLAYVEILTKTHVPIVQAKIALSNGFGNGSFELPSDLASGNYIFRAYTNWMKNFDADFYFEKPITIVNTVRNEAPVDPQVSKSEYDLQFFPEGGNLVNGIESTVGFRIADQSGKGVNCKGVIVNQNDDTVSNFSSFKFGIGSFRFLPVKNAAYKAIVNLPNGVFIEKSLPGAYDDGYVLQVKKGNDDKIVIKVESSNNYNGQNIYLFIHSRQQVEESKSAVLTNNIAEFSLDETKFADGISHITVFNASKQPVCERLIFNKPTRRLIIEGTSDKQQYESRKKITIDVVTRDETENKQPANLSLSVYRTDSLSLIDQNTIESYAWLSSDLKGNIESPAYYFTEAEGETEQALDNLMLTHGWRRFMWEEVLKTDKYSFAYYPEYVGHIIPAIVVNKETGSPANAVASFLAVPGKYFQFYTAQSNEKGHVNFYTKELYGKHELFAQGGGKSRDYRIDIKNPFSENYSSKPLPSFSLEGSSGTMLQAKSINMQVQKIYFGSSQNKFFQPFVDTSFFYKPTKTYLLDNYVRFATMEEVLREYVTEIVVNRQNNKLVLAAGRRDESGIVYRYEPLTMLDGVPLLDDPNKIFSYDPLKVKALDIINRRFFVGNAIFEGIINFRTYKGSPEGLEPDPNATVLDYEGLQLQREFFAPVYETENQMASRMPDFRNLLYWAPSLQTSASGKQQVSFYTSDLAGKYIVFIEGVGAGGRCGTKSFLIEVTNPLFAQK